MIYAYDNNIEADTQVICITAGEFKGIKFRFTIVQYTTDGKLEYSFELVDSVELVSTNQKFIDLTKEILVDIINQGKK